ncbi:MAG: CHAD domain-containing protein [Bryobacteraceae bacterium]
MQKNSEVKPQYCFEKDEDLPEGTRRILSEQLSRAVQMLSTPGDSLEHAVHEARRCLKRARSALRLIKFAVPNTFARENQRLRNVGRSLSELRDAHALTQTLRELEEHQNAEEAGSPRVTLEKAYEFLRTREARIMQAMEKGGMENAIAQLNEAATRMRKLSYGHVDPQGISKSLRKSIKRGKKAFAATEDDTAAERFHEWRKRAKDLRFQLSLLASLRPDLQPYSNSAKELEQLLGDDHNLAVLSAVLSETQLPEHELQALRTGIDYRQNELRGKARTIGSYLYADKRKVWKHRLSAKSIAPQQARA